MELYLRVVLVCWCAALSSSAVLPHHLYAGLPMQQAVGWRESAAAARPSPHQRFVGDNSETYGYVDRFPTAERTNHQLVFGVPHRFTENYPSPYESLLSAAASDYDTYDNGQYFVPAAYYRPPEPELNKRAMRYSPYDLMEEDNDIGQNDYQVVGPSQEDVLNFQKYIQRYFHPTKAETEAWNTYDDLSVDYPAWMQDDDSAATQEPVYNDEEAAVQLHSLLPARSVKLAKDKTRPLVKDVQKKSAESTTTSTTTTTVKPAATSSAAGQKEEPMLRPPTRPRHPSPVSTAQPQAEDKQVPESMVDTIKRLFEMRNQVQVRRRLLAVTFQLKNDWIFSG